MNPFVRGCSRVLASAVLPIVVRAERRYRQVCYERPEVLARVGGLEFALRLLQSAGVDYNPEILRQLGASVGADCIIHSPLMIYNARGSLANLSIGARVHLGRDVFLDVADRIEIADAVTVSMRSIILTHIDVGRSPLARFFPRKEAPVRLGHGCYLGAGAIVLSGVTVGTGAVVAAGAVVIADVPDHAVVGGVPARPLKNLPSLEQSTGARGPGQAAKPAPGAGGPATLGSAGAEASHISGVAQDCQVTGVGSERWQHPDGQALRDSQDAPTMVADPNIHSPELLAKEYSGRDWRAYQWLVAACVEHGEPGPILDIGAGTGLFVDACQRYGLTCVGLEGSPYAVEEGRTRYQIDIRQHFLSRPLPFQDATFSVVVCNQTIEHLTPEIARNVLRESLRVLRPRGLLAIYSPCRHDPVQAAEPTHINLYTPAKLREVVVAEGFTKYRAIDDARPVFGTSRPMRVLASLIFRVSKWDMLSESANCLAYKPC